MASRKECWGWTSGKSLRGASAALTLAVVLGLGVTTTQLAQAQTFTVLHSFCSQSNCTDGGNPYAGLIQDAAGNLYGTTSLGGAYYGSGYYGAGTVFELDRSGVYTVLYSFCSVSGCPDGEGPVATLVLDAQGNLYGTTGAGGGTGCNGNGCGTVFKVDTSGNETVLYSFNGGTADGCFPYGGVVLDAAGNLYGTTTYCGSHNYGTVFKVDTSGTETVLHSFGSGGASPMYSSLLMDAKGDLYGVNSLALYKVSSSGTFTVLHTFLKLRDGIDPYGTPAMDRQGNLYGTTERGGRYSDGTVWKVSPKRKLTVLHSFRHADGIEPRAGVVLDAQGNLYGTTWRGGAHSVDGTVYKLNKKGVLTVLHSFAYARDGAEPYGNLILDAAGNLYGSAWVGGNYNDECQGYRNEQGCGTVWKLTP